MRFVTMLVLEATTVISRVVAFYMLLLVNM